MRALLATALLAATLGAGCSVIDRGTAPEPAPDQAWPGDVVRLDDPTVDGWTTLDQLAVEGTELRFSIPHGVVRVGVSEPAEVVPAGVDPVGSSRRAERPVAVGAAYTLAWDVELDVRLAELASADRPWSLSLVAVGEHVPVASSTGAVTSGTDPYVGVVTDVGQVGVLLEWDGESQVQAIDEPVGDAGRFEPYADGLPVHQGSCATGRDEIGIDGRVVGLPWWPSLGWAEPGFVWRVVGLRAPGDPGVLRGSQLTLAPGREPAREIRVLLGDEDEVGAVFEVPADLGADVPVTVTLLDGRSLTCRPAVAVRRTLGNLGG